MISPHATRILGNIVTSFKSAASTSFLIHSCNCYYLHRLKIQSFGICEAVKSSVKDISLLLAQLRRRSPLHCLRDFMTFSPLLLTNLLAWIPHYDHLARKAVKGGGYCPLRLLIHSWLSYWFQKLRLADSSQFGLQLL